MDENLSYISRDNEIFVQFHKRYVIHQSTEPCLSLGSKNVQAWKTGKYPIGHGGQGKVFLQTCARGDRQGMQRAVKIIPTEEGVKRSRHLQELGTILRFSHAKFSQYFVKSLGWYQMENALCITMDYHPKGDLFTYLAQNGSLAENEASEITNQVLKGLEIMYEEGFVHRDIKPQNVLIQQHPTSEQPGWWVKLADFGISKKFVDRPSISKTTTLLGTEQYMAPELFQRDGDIDYQKADMWALGVMVHFLCTKAHLFHTSWDVFEYKEKGNSKFPPDILERSQLSVDCQHFIGSLLLPNPGPRISAHVALAHPWAQLFMQGREHRTPESSDWSDTDSDSAQSLVEEERGLTTMLSTRSMHPMDSQSPHEGDKNGVIHSTIPSPHDSPAPPGSAEDATTPEAAARTKIGKEKSNPLYFASLHGHFQLVKTLIERIGVDVNAPGPPPSGFTPLHAAAEGGFEEITRYLLDNGADMTAQTKENHTPLHIAAFNDKQNIIKVLLENGADVNICTNEGWTALYIAASNGRLEAVKLLAQGGATIQTNCTHTALDGAAIHGHTEVVTYLLSLEFPDEDRSGNDEPGR